MQEGEQEKIYSTTYTFENIRSLFIFGYRIACLMKKYGENKIFVEGKSDKIFIDFLLLQFFNIEDKNLVIVVEGKDKLKNNPLLRNQRIRSKILKSDNF